jgi:NhaP-type Na+/H+ or K+/H+ antiporter
MGELDAPIVAWTSMNPHLIMLIFLPPLIFESAFNTDAHLFYYEIWKILALAGPAVIASTYLTAVVMYYILGYNDHGFTFTAALMLGAILSATDSVAVVALLKELGASKRLSTLIEGESLMNDGTAMVVFLVLFDMVEG